MKAVSVRQLKSNPSAALRDAREQPVMVLNRQQPEALLVHLSDNSLLAEPGIRLALATALYKDESLSLGRAAEFSGVALAEFIDHISRLGIPVVRGANAVRKDVSTLSQVYHPPEKAFTNQHLASAEMGKWHYKVPGCGLRGL